MTSAHVVPVSQTAAPAQFPGPRPPLDPWAPPQPEPAWVPPGAVSQGSAGQPIPVPVGFPAAPDAPFVPDASTRAAGYAAPPHGQLPQTVLPGYANAPARSGPPVAPAPFDGAPDWTSWDAGRRAGTNGLAIATFVASWVFWPAALVMGPVALLSKRRRGQSGRGWAVAGVVLSLIWAVASVIVMAAVFSFLGSGQLAALTGVSRGTAADLQAVAVGQCFLDGGDKTLPVDCALPHDGEVFFTGAVVGTGTLGYPGELVLQTEAEAMCDPAFASYVGRPYEQSRWHYNSWVPSEESWADGDRAAACAVVPFGDETLTGAAAGSAL